MKINFNMKRITATVLAGFVLAGSYPEPVRASDIGEYLANIPVISQKEKRFQTSEYKYIDRYFGDNGCGPASITNGLLTLFNITDSDMAGLITEEVLRLTCDGHLKKNGINMENLSLLDMDMKSFLEDRKQYYPNLYNLVTNYSGDIIYMNSKLDKDSLVNQLDNNMPYTYIYKMSMQDNLEYIIETVNTLYNNGNYDANLIFTCIGGGTVNTNGPFRSGNAGHYLTFVINVKDFYENGSLYVLDSNPKGLTGEKIGAGTRYKYYYDFANIKKSEFNDFYNNYDVNRISDNVLKVSLNDNKLTYLHNLLQTGVSNLVDDYRIMLLKPLPTYGTGMLLLSIPEKENIREK